MKRGNGDFSENFVNRPAASPNYTGVAALHIVSFNVILLLVSAPELDSFSRISECCSKISFDLCERRFSLKKVCDIVGANNAIVEELCCLTDQRRKLAKNGQPHTSPIEDLRGLSVELSIAASSRDVKKIARAQRRFATCLAVFSHYVLEVNTDSVKLRTTSFPPA